MKRAQAWSLDIMIAITVFLGVIFLFLSILNNSQGDISEELKKESSSVIETISSYDPDAREDEKALKLIEGNKVNATILENLIGQPYDEIKNKFRVKNDICIYFEDEEGNIIYVNPDEVGIGIKAESVDGELKLKCGEE